MRVNAAIVAHENPQLMLDAAVESVLREKKLINRLYFIDNSPTDRLRRRFESRTEYIFNDNNLGFGRANNIAMRKSIEDGIEYHLLVNPDVYFDEGVIEGLVAYMDANPDVGLAAPKSVYPDGSIQRLCKLIPTPLDLFGRRFLGWGPFKKYIDRRNESFELHHSGYDKEMDVPILSGSFMMLRTSVLERAGVFDERYFLYLEDFDLCRRIGESARTVFYPKVSITHEYKKGSYFQRRLFGHHIVSAVRYFMKWGWLFDAKRSERNRQCLQEFGCQEE
jgi:GT2 family glycosyltransferase